LILNKIPAIGKGAAKALGAVKGSVKYLIVPGMIFEELGFKYLGPIDGHDITELNRVLSRAKTIKGPVLIHVCTQKGKGYTYAEESPQVFHGIRHLRLRPERFYPIKAPGTRRYWQRAYKSC
jgi:1-deoxy-D-xylulose-5-phosphate synthase